jgi:hypothetical protein
MYTATHPALRADNVHDVTRLLEVNVARLDMHPVGLPVSHPIFGIQHQPHIVRFRVQWAPLGFAADVVATDDEIFVLLQ